MDEMGQFFKKAWNVKLIKTFVYEQKIKKGYHYVFKNFVSFGFFNVSTNQKLPSLPHDVLLLEFSLFLLLEI